MNGPRFIKKIIMYSDVYNNKNYIETNFIKDLVLFSRVVCRQRPLIVVNNKNEILGIKNTLRNKNLNLFLYKFINFIVPKLKKDLIFDSDILRIDDYCNLNFILKSKSYFFEYKTNISSNFDNIFDIRFIFNKNIEKEYKIDYINNVLKLNLFK